MHRLPPHRLRECRGAQPHTPPLPTHPRPPNPSTPHAHARLGEGFNREALTRWSDAQDLADWEIGVHGVLIDFTDDHGHARSAVYLPEVLAPERSPGRPSENRAGAPVAELGGSLRSSNGR